LRRAHHFDPDAQPNGGHVTGRVRVRRLCPPYELCTDSDQIPHGGETTRCAKPRDQIEECIGRGLRNALINAGSHGPIQAVERQKLEHGNNKRSEGFSKIMLVQADTSIQHLNDSRQRAQNL
jgi:hypothetical protein